MQGWPLAKWQLLSTLNAYEQLMTSVSFVLFATDQCSTAGEFVLC